MLKNFILFKKYNNSTYFCNELPLVNLICTQTCNCHTIWFQYCSSIISHMLFCLNNHERSVRVFWEWLFFCIVENHHVLVLWTSFLRSGVLNTTLSCHRCVVTALTNLFSIKPYLDLVESFDKCFIETHHSAVVHQITDICNVVFQASPITIGGRQAVVEIKRTTTRGKLCYV